MGTNLTTTTQTAGLFQYTQQKVGGQNQQLDGAKLAEKAREVLKNADKNNDGKVTLQEMLEGGGLTPGNFTDLNKTELTGLWASVAGPNGSLSARELGAFWLHADKDQDGQINQEEGDDIKKTLGSLGGEDLGRGNVLAYNTLQTLASQKGLDDFIQRDVEQHRALQHEAMLVRQGFIGGGLQAGMPGFFAGTGFNGLLPTGFLPPLPPTPAVPTNNTTPPNTDATENPTGDEISTLPAPPPLPPTLNQLPQGQGFFPPQGQGFFPPQGQGFFPPQGQGFFPLQGQGFFPPQGQGFFPPQGLGFLPNFPPESPQRQSQIGSVVNALKGLLPSVPPESPQRQALNARIDFLSSLLSSQGQGFFPAQGLGFFPPQGQGFFPTQGQGFFPTQGLGGFSIGLIPQGLGMIPPKGGSV